MTQHITIYSLTDVRPDIASVWRDDQVLMWGFAPESRLAWPPDFLEPIQFTNDNPNYAPWPGSNPVPVGAKPDVGPDRRFYIAMAQMIMPNGETAMYNYTINVVDEFNNLQRVQVHRTKPDGTVEVIDPEVENEPQP